MSDFHKKIKPCFIKIINYYNGIIELSNNNIEKTNEMLEEYSKKIESILDKKNFDKFKNALKQNLESIEELYNSYYIEKIKNEVENLKDVISNMTIESLNNSNQINENKSLNEQEKKKFENYEQYLNKGKETNPSNIHQSKEIIIEKDFIEKYFYSIHIVSNKIFVCDFNKKDKKELISELQDILARHKDEIFVISNNKRNFIDSFIKIKESELKLKYEKLCDIKEYKEFNSLVNDLISKECNIDINHYLDPSGNKFDFNTSCNIKRGTEEYNPPYGWIGIGLKVTEKYDDDDWLFDKSETSEWAIAYHGIGYIYNSDEIKKAIKDILENGLKQGDKNEGIVLNPDINSAESNCGLIIFNGKKYKAVLMVKALISKIKKDKSKKGWFVDKENIRPYRILLKKM